MYHRRCSTLFYVVQEESVHRDATPGSKPDPYVVPEEGNDIHVRASRGSTTTPDLGASDAWTSRLSQLLRGELGLTTSQTMPLVETVEWKIVPRGDRVVGSPIDGNREWLIVSGRLEDSSSGRVLSAGEFAVDGIAVRNLVAAGLDRSILDEVSGAAPRLAVALDRSRRTAHSAKDGCTVVVLVADDLDARYVVSRLGGQLSAFGETALQWAHRVDVSLGTSGISHAELGEPDDLVVSEYLHAVEDQHDFVLLEVEPQPDPWARRALSMADRIAVVVRADTAPETIPRLAETLDHAPPTTERTLVVVHPRSHYPSETGRMLESSRCENAIHVDDSRPGEWARTARTIVGHARGMVMGGGGARGFAHLGVYRALTEYGVEPDVLGGSSIGAPLAVAMADRYPPDELEALVAERFSKVIDYTMPIVAMTRGRGIAEATTATFGGRQIEDLRLPAFCVSTNLTTSEVHVHKSGSIVHAVRASCAIPGMMPPVPHEGDLLIDGGTTNNLPIDVVRTFTQHGRVVASDVVPAQGPRAREGLELWVSGSRAVRERIRGRRSAPPVTVTLLRALAVGSANRQEENQTKQMADLVVELDLRGIPMFAFDRVSEIARIGYEQARPQIEGWLFDNSTEGRTDVVVDAS